MTDGDLLAAISKILDDHARDSLERDAELARQIEEVAGLQRVANGQLNRVNAEIGWGLPDSDQRTDRRTMRQRIHDLEGDQAGRRMLRARRRSDWSLFQKVGLFIFAGVAAVSSVLRVFGIEIGL